MLLAIAAVVVGLAALAWSADRFVEGASAVARYLGMPALLIGMVVVGFGTSAPELVVSALAAADDSPELALGNALGSNTANIGLILAVTAIIAPVAVHRGVLRKEIPVLLLVTIGLAALILDGNLSAVDSGVLIVVLGALVTWSVLEARRSPQDPLAGDVTAELEAKQLSKRAAWLWLGFGLVALVVASRILVWGAVEIAQALGWSELVIGLTIVAVGTSAPELASSLAAARKGEMDLALGNVVGSNLFNTLGVIGLAGVISPISLPTETLSRDIPVVLGFTIAIVLFALWPLGKGVINRLEGWLLLLAFTGYTAVLILGSA